MKCKVVLFSSCRITLVCPGLTSVTFPYFAVIAFILQKVQQGIAIPKRIPSPLKAILPPAPTRSMWDLNEKKVDELTKVWEATCKGKSVIPTKEGKAAIQKVCKKVPIANQMYEWVVSIICRTKLLTNEESGFTKKQFIVGIFMAQVGLGAVRKYRNTARERVSPHSFLPN